MGLLRSLPVRICIRGLGKGWMSFPDELYFHSEYLGWWSGSSDKSACLASVKP
jgi:hypothetical protein